MTNMKLPNSYKQLSEEEIEYDGCGLSSKKLGDIMGAAIACMAMAYGGYMLISGLGSAIAAGNAAAAAVATKAVPVLNTANTAVAAEQIGATLPQGLFGNL